jgi:SHS2 domain-containing protein
VEAVQPQVTLGDGAVISSSRIRSLLQEGRVDQAALMLGRYPSLSGEVVAGARRGRKLGFPTANLEVRPERAVPANGVYAAFALLGSRRLPAVANVGVRPSFDNGQRTVETHILDFDQDIYGCDLVVEFVARLRDEVRFESMAGLIAQIERDSQQARQILCTGRAGAGVTEVELGSREPGIDGFVDWESGVGSRGGVTPPARAGLPRPYRYREVEHTADRAIRVWGRELPNLFVGAAQGMVHLMADLEGVAGTHWRTIALEAIDLESLLVNWLNELLFLTEIEGILFVEHRVEELTGTRLVARAGGVPGEVTKARVKAATFHDLRLARDETGWSTTITFDV